MGFFSNVSDWWRGWRWKGRGNRRRGGKKGRWDRRLMMFHSWTRKRREKMSAKCCFFSSMLVVPDREVMNFKFSLFPRTFLPLGPSHSSAPRLFPGAKCPMSHILTEQREIIDLRPSVPGSWKRTLHLCKRIGKENVSGSFSGIHLAGKVVLMSIVWQLIWLMPLLWDVSQSYGFPWNLLSWPESRGHHLRVYWSYWECRWGISGSGIEQ